MLNKSFYIVLAGAVMALSGANAAGTQVQTVQSTDRAYETVENRLSTVTTQIGDIIDTTGTQKTAISGLLSNKQNRPNESCEQGKSCLLVKDANGTEHWYPIIDCSLNSFLNNVGTDTTFGGSYYGGYRITSAGQRACAASGANCSTNEWMRSFANGVVYGEARAVSISEQAEGTIVRLPNNVQAGNICVCRAKAYRVKNGNTYGERQTVTTDNWVVRGSLRDATDSDCVIDCAFDGDSQSGAGIDVPYYAYIANACSAPAPEAQMCTLYSFFDNVYNNGVIQPHHSAFYVSNSVSSGCGTGSYFAGNPHCSIAGSWIVDAVPSGQGGGSLGYIFGTSGYATIAPGTAVNSIVNLSASDMSSTGTAQHNAIVCMVQGYKASGDSSETTVTLNKALVVAVDDTNGFNDGDLNSPARYCMNAAATTYGMDWYHVLGTTCAAQ